MHATFKNTRKKKVSNQVREVWIVEDDAMLGMIVSKFLTSKSILCKVFNSVTDFKEHFVEVKNNPPLLLLDYSLGDYVATDLVMEMKQKGYDFNFLVMTGHGDEHLAVEIMKAGALDYIVKSETFVYHLPLAIQQAFNRIDMSNQLKDSRRDLSLSLKKQKRLNAKVVRQKLALEYEQAKAYKLLTNVLPEKIAREILTTGTAKATYYPCVSVLFADVRDFSSMALAFSPIDLVQMLDDYFSEFDIIIGNLKLEKIKTIGDCYMCAGGIPVSDPNNAFRIVIAGLQMQHYLLKRCAAARKNGSKAFDMRIGIHTGEVVAGVVGHRKFSYDIWGDAANTASWIVHAGAANRVNVSRNTYEFIKDYFICQSRGSIAVKGNKLVEMFFVDRLKPEYCSDSKGIKPNALFWEKIKDRVVV